MSPDGQYFAFSSVRKLTGYDNESLAPGDCGEGDLCPEIFLYDAANSELTCVSCAPDGEQPTGVAEFGFPLEELLTPESPSYVSRNVLDDGRVFFDTSSALVPQATNGEVNVYEYEGGTDYLISGGVGSGRSEFLDASPSGDDVFFSTGQGLVQGDTDDQPSAYDARVDGGFPPAPGQGEQAGACESQEACESPPSEPPAQLVAASSVLSAGGNLLAPPTPVTPSQPTSPLWGGQALYRYACAVAGQGVEGVCEEAQGCACVVPGAGAEAVRGQAVQAGFEKGAVRRSGHRRLIDVRKGSVR